VIPKSKQRNYVVIVLPK